MDEAKGAWWEQHWVHALLVLATAVPLIYPSFPPLVDLPGHMGRYAVELDQGHASTLQHYYRFQWQLVGNLGIDLLIIPFSKVFGLVLGVKLICIAIQLIAATGILWIAREVHGKVTPTALFALPLIYGHPFVFGFINYSLAMAMALCGFAFWLRLERLRRYKVRAIVFLIFSPLLWITHIYSWAALCLLAGSSELIHQHDRSGKWGRALIYAFVQCLSLAPPILLMAVWRNSGHAGGHTEGWFEWYSKYGWFCETLRERWPFYDQACVWLLTAIIVVAVPRIWLSFSRNLALSAMILLAVYLCVPYVVFGSAYADMRLTPYIFIIALLGIRFPPKVGNVIRHSLALAGLAFFATRLAATTYSFAIISQAQSRSLVALDYVPQGARLLSFVGRSCRTSWNTNRSEHLPGMALVKRHAFSNDQWEMPGAQLLRATYPDGAPLDRYFGHDPSQMITEPSCRSRIWRPLNWSLANFPRNKFDYVWLIEPPVYDHALTHGMTQIWSDGRNALYRIDDHSPWKPSA